MVTDALRADVKLKLSALTRECIGKAEAASSPVGKREWLEAAEIAVRGMESIERTEALERRRDVHLADERR